MLELKRDWKAIFTDIDGTLLNSAREVSAKTREALRRCAREGVRIVLSSSRSPQGIEPIVNANDLTCCIIAFGGGLVLDEDRTRLHERGMSREEAAEVVDFVEAKLSDVTWNAFTADDWVVRSREDPRVLREERIVKTLAQEGLVRNLPDGRMVDKVLCMCLPERSAEVECTLKRRFPSLSISRSSDILVEVNAAGVSKAVALRAFCEAKGIRVEDTLAFGDNYNDLEMLRAAGLGVAMGNAPDDIRDIAGFVTSDNDHDGIACALRTLMA